MGRYISLCEQLGILTKVYDIKDDMGYIIYHEFQLRDEISYWEYIDYNEYGDIRYIENSSGTIAHYE